MKRVAVLGLCVLSAGLLAAELPSRRPQGLLAAGYFFPSAANTTNFKTRMVFTNPTGFTISIVAALATDKGSGGTQTIALGPSESRVYENFLGEVFGATGGAGFSLAETTGSRPFYAVGEVWAENSGGRFGTPLVGMSADDRVVNLALQETGSSMSTGVRVNASNRANFGCANMDGTAVAIRADFYVDASPDLDKPAATVTLNVPANGWAQTSVPAGLSGEKIRILFWQLSTGGFHGSYCYGVNVNNQSNDGTSLPALYAPDVR